jgi:hypothetical protein
MSNPTTPFGWQMPTNTDLVTDLPADFEVFGQAVASSMADLLGGTSGQVLSKNSNTDMDFIWTDANPGDITGITATSPLTGGGTSGAVTVGIQASSTTQSGAVQLTDSTSSTSTTTAATPNSVKTSYDLAAAAIPKSTVTTSGDVIYATGSSAVTRLGIGSTGQVLTVAGGVPTWATAAGGAGLTKVSTSSFSGVSTHSVNSVFSSTYRNYRIILDITSVSGTPDIRMKMRASGTDSTTGLYQSRMLMYANTMYVDELSNQAYWWVGLQDNTKQEAGATAFDLFTPNVAIKTKMNGIVWGVGGAQFLSPVGGYVNNSTQYDGFTIYTTGGTMDGSVTIYGYSN